MGVPAPLNPAAFNSSLKAAPVASGASASAGTSVSASSGGGGGIPAPLNPAAFVSHSSPSTPVGGGGAFPTIQPKPQSGVGGVIHAIGHGIGAGYNDLSAGLEGFWGGLTHPGAQNPVSGAIHGFLHPAQEHQIYNQAQQQENTQIGNPVGKFLNNLSSGVETDPLSYVPFGKVAEATGVLPALRFTKDLAKGAVKTGEAIPKPMAEAAAKATRTMPKLSPKQAKAMNEWAGIKSAPKEVAATSKEPNFQLRGGPLAVIPKTEKESVSAAAKAPYAKYAWQSRVGAPIAKAAQYYAPNGLPGIKPLLNASSKVNDMLFKALPGTTNTFKNNVSRMYGERASGANEINTKLKEIFKGTTPEQRTALTHALESTKPRTKLADPKLDELRQKVEPLMQKAESTARAKGLLTKSLDLDAMGVQRYLPHIHVGKFDVGGNPITNGRLLKASIDANKTRDIAGTIHNINAKSQGPKFESDALKVIAHHLHSINNATTAKDLIDHTLAHGLDLGGSHGLSVGDLHPETKTPLVEYEHDGKSALVPTAHAEFINGMNKAKEGGLSKLSRGMTNFWNRTMFAGNPVYHPLVNLLPQAIMHAPSALPDIIKSLPEAFKGVKPGGEMDNAVKSGAMNLFSNIESKGNTAKRVESLVNAVDHQPGLLRKGMHEWNAITPKSEMAFRSGVFNNALQRGATEEEAANKVRNIFGGHIAPGTMSDAEKAVSTLMPFINWTKTSIGSNVGKALTNPFRYSVLGHGLNAINQENSGHGMLQNPNPVSVAIGKDAQGNTRYLSLPGALFDAAKLAKDIGKEGLVHGVGDFAESRFTPWIRFIDQIRTGQQNPSAPVTQQYSVNPAPFAKYATHYTPQQIEQAQQRGIFFGDTGPKVNPNLAQFLQDISIPGGDLMPEQGQPVFPSIIARTLGSSLSTPNPESLIKESKYDSRTGNEEVKSQIKKRAKAQVLQGIKPVTTGQLFGSH